MKKKLAVFLTLITIMAVCFTVSDYSWASSTSSESYMATSVKKVHTTSPMIWELSTYNYMANDGEAGYSFNCDVCGAWMYTCAQHNLEFKNTSFYNTEKNIADGMADSLHEGFHNIKLGYSNGATNEAYPITTKIHLNQDLYEVTGVKPVKK